MLPPPGRKWKRSDLPSWWLQTIVWFYGMTAWEHLTDTLKIPKKVVVAAFERDIALGHLEPGANERMVFLPRRIRDPHGVYVREYHGPKLGWVDKRVNNPDH